MIYTSRYINSETGIECFKRLVVKEIDGLFRVYEETERGWGSPVTSALIASIKPYKTRKGAEKAAINWQPKQYKMTLVEGLMSEGKI